jgi:hypothetical protein
MYIYIDDREFWLDFGCFTEKISRLKKLEQIKFKINLYDDIVFPECEFISQFSFLKLLKTLPETIYASK